MATVTVIVGNTQRALQLENQRLHQENAALGREIDRLREELAAARDENRGLRLGQPSQPQPTATGATGATVMTRARSGIVMAPGTRAPAAPIRVTAIAAPRPRQVIHIVATDTLPNNLPVPSAPRDLTAARPSAAPRSLSGSTAPQALPAPTALTTPRTAGSDSESLDDAATRFRLLELD
jgi:hypothetical protein